MPAERTFRIIEIVPPAAVRALLLRYALVPCVCGEEFEPSAARTGVDIDLHRSGQKIGKIAEQPARLTELKLLPHYEIHALPAAQAVDVLFHGSYLNERGC